MKPGFDYVGLFLSRPVFGNPYLVRNKWWMKYIPFLSGYISCRHAYNMRKNTRKSMGHK